MTGAVIATHGKLALELLDTAEFITGKLDFIMAITLDPSDPIETIQKNIKNAIKDVDNGDGVIIFTDMFGGTPSNISLSFLEKGRLEVITGVNLPMIIKFAQLAGDSFTLEKIAAEVVEHARKSINHATAILE